jgi:hypothetical protein
MNKGYPLLKASFNLRYNRDFILVISLDSTRIKPCYTDRLLNDSCCVTISLNPTTQAFIGCFAPV